MNYDLQKAVKRFQFRFAKDEKGQYKNFKPTKEDVDAINTIFGWINRQKEESVLNHTLFAKLYIYFLKQSIKYYETTVFDEKLQSEVNKILEYPLETFFTAFTNDLYASQFNTLQKNDSLKDANNKMVDIKRFKEAFTPEYIKSKLIDMISEALNRFSETGTILKEKK